MVLDWPFGTMSPEPSKVKFVEDAVSLEEGFFTLPPVVRLVAPS